MKVTGGRGGVALVIGATSDIGAATARRLGTEMRAVQLAGRDAERLEQLAREIRMSTEATVTVHACDVLQPDGGVSLLEALESLPDLAVCLVGAMGEQRAAERDGRMAAEIMRANYVGPALLVGALAERFAVRGSGVLVGIGSVAGDRGRQSNYVYGSAKAGFAAFLSGLRNRLAGKGVHVLTVKPGYVRTRMTEGMELPGWLTATADEVAAVVVKAARARRNVVYVRGRWRFVMWVVRLIPEGVFKRLSL